MRRITYILIAILILAGIGGGVFFWYQFTQTNGGGDGGPVSDFFSALFPFGTPSNGTGPNGDGTTPQQENAIAPRLRQVSAAPVSGFGIVERNGEPFIQYMDRATGNIFETAASTTASWRISITTVPRVEEAFWLRDGGVIMRYLDENGAIVSFSAVVATSTEGGELSGRFLPENITTLVARPDGKQIFYILTDTSGAHGFTANTDGTKRISVFESPLKGWNAQWAATSTIIMTNKSSHNAPGVAYRLDPSSGALSRLAGPYQGLAARANSAGSDILFSYATADSFSSRFYSIKNGLGAGSALPSLAEKCVWAARSSVKVYCGAPIAIEPALYPDSWYQGVRSFSDDIWTVSTDGKPAELLEASSDSISNGLDLINPHVDSKNEYLVFMNKKDLSLWSLKINK